MEKLNLVSANYKTRWSINFPISETCQPTKTCFRLCYGRHGRLTTPISLTRQHKVFQVFQNEDPEKIAAVIATGYRRRGLNWLRWCGVGDLNSQSCKVVNILGTKYQDTRHKVVTRKVGNIKQLEHDMPNMYIMFSLDGDPESIKRKARVDAINHPRVYYSFLRETADQDTLGAPIIFDAHSMKGKLPFDPKRCCPVDSGRMAMENACEKCKKCFSPGVYK